MEEISREEYETALKKMKYGKAPGEDGVAIELIKRGREKLNTRILKLINECYRRDEYRRDGKSR